MIIDDKQTFKDVFKKLELFSLGQEEIKGGQGWWCYRFTFA